MNREHANKASAPGRRSESGVAMVLLLAALAASPLACKRSEAPAPPPAPPAGAPAMPPQGAAAPVDYMQRIAAAERIVAEDPKNLQAWIQLGNDYFDTRQREKAVRAYGRALELDPKNPDVLTDQGVMYRELGQFDQAIANFEKANQAAPQHLQSLFNLGVVYAYDKKDPAKAIAAWNTIIERAPSSPQAAQAREAIQALRQAPATPSMPGR